jgi:zinc protease
MTNPDRKNCPPVLQSVPKEPEPPVFYHLSNGIPVYLISSGDEEVMKADFVFRAGQICETAPLVSSTVNMMLNEGTVNYSAAELNKTVDYYGAVPSFFYEKDLAGLSLVFLTRYSKEILDLCHEMLFMPVFPDNELDALRRKRVQWYDVRQERVQSVAYDRFFGAVFGETHPYGKIPLREDYLTVNREMLTEFHSKWYVPANLTVILSGKIPSDTRLILEAIFGGAEFGIYSKPPAELFSLPLPSQTVLSEKKDALQSAVRIGSATINKRHADYPALKITDTILGGYFGSRLMKNLREEKGYTYGIHSAVVSFELSGYKVISTEVGADHTRDSVNEIMNEISRLQNDPVSPEELSVVRNYMLGELVRMFDGPFSLSESFRSVWEFGMGFEYYSRLAEKIKTITPDEIMRIARTYYKPEDQFRVIAGKL